MSDCYVFTWDHENEMEYWGFYNLGIKGTIQLTNKNTNKTYSFTNPVFSYCPDGKLYIYPSGKIDEKYPADTWPNGYTVWKYTFTATSGEISNFAEKMKNAIDFDTLTGSHKSKTNYSLSCNLEKDNAFHTYSETYRNCFGAVAVWADWLGNDTLLDIYEKAHNNTYKEYLPDTMYNNDNYSNYWVETTYDSSATD